MAKDIDAVLKKEKIKHSILLGHRMGGMVALSYYSMFPKKVKALVIAESSYKKPLSEGPLKPLAWFIVKSLDLFKKILPDRHYHVNFHKGHWNDIKVVIKGLLSTRPRAYDESLHAMLRFDKTRMLKSIKVPTLIIAGTKDPLFTLPTEKKMNQKIKGSLLDIVQGEHVAVLNKAKFIEKQIESFLRLRLVS